MGFVVFLVYFLHTYIPDRFDEYAILDQLETILCDNWQMDQMEMG